MGYTTSTVHGIEVPDSSEANNVPEDIGKVVTALEGGSLVKRLTQAQIDALTTAQKPNGLVVFNTTTGYLQQSNGSTFRDVANRVATDFLVVGSVSANAYLQASPTTPARLYFDAGSNSRRWIIRKNTTSQSGGNTGNDFEIARYADNGSTELGTPVTIRRSDGRVTLERSTVAGDPATTVVTKDYADAIGVWQDWTPDASGPATYSSSGRYTKIGRTVHAQMYLTVTARGSGSYTFTLPATAATTLGGTLDIGGGMLYGTSYSKMARCQLMSSTTARISIEDGIVSSSMPSSPTTITLNATLTYESA